MNIEEAKEAKIALERTISNAVTKFANDSKLPILNVYINEQAIVRNESGTPIAWSYTTEVEVKL